MIKLSWIEPRVPANSAMELEYRAGLKIGCRDGTRQLLFVGQGLKDAGSNVANAT